MMSDDDNDGQMKFGDLGGIKLPDIRLTGEEKPRKNLTQETCPDRGSNPSPVRDRRACCRLAHSGGPNVGNFGPHSSPVIIRLPYIIRQRTSTVSDHSCSSWPSLNDDPEKWFHGNAQDSNSGGPVFSPRRHLVTFFLDFS